MIFPSGKNDCTPAGVCAEIAGIFKVRTTEVGLLQLKDGALTFLFPTELRAAGSIPITSSAIAARTAESRKAEIFNKFAEVKHHTVFERVKISDEPNNDCLIIQKLMSSPVIGVDETVLGVLQISRKGVTPAAAGPDFEARDLKTLADIAIELASLLPYITDSKAARRRLRFLR